MYLDVWINGRSSYWEGRKREPGKTPNGDRSPFFLLRSDYNCVLNRIKRGRYEGREIDPAFWEAVVTKEDIQAYINENYGEGGKDYLAFMKYSPQAIKEVNELLDFVDKLEDGKEYSLYASEL